ncbi:MAG: hypothetical protein K0A92_09745, partial [Methyloprofundus sp.]|nr:hypothetical protein [Methyloprofundus sp.]
LLFFSYNYKTKEVKQTQQSIKAYDYNLALQHQGVEELAILPLSLHRSSFYFDFLLFVGI